ncbi:MAG: 3',5'-cyclic-nucleotide phosphodiesterase, partial [Burkholderiales bacterium]|nr:3',5'-cyclic-nucleotide phosphodiesterase [Burkholderiales bacterium]
AGRPPVRVYALAPTLDALRAHILNGVIWPDFTRLPSRERPTLELVPIAHGERLRIGSRTIEVLPAAHTVPACGYAVEGARGCWVFTGDTGPNPALWDRLARLEVATLVIETAFGDEDADLARLSRHLCPALLREELARLARPTDVYITHIKPGEVDAVMSEIGAAASPHRIRALQAGQCMALD